ncbi:MAG: hypothetical protein LBE13_04925 [Bacteroidales bacterium]|nr:hypothetical protein [Bacteroidales bacterium]
MEKTGKKFPVFCGGCVEYLVEEYREGLMSNCLDCFYCKVSSKSIGNDRYCYCSKNKIEGIHEEYFWRGEELCEEEKRCQEEERRKKREEAKNHPEEEKPDNKNKDIKTTNEEIKTGEKTRSILVRVEYKVKLSPTVYKDEQMEISVQDHTENSIISELRKYYPDQEIKLWNIYWPYTFGPVVAPLKPGRRKKPKGQSKYDPLKEYLINSKKNVEILSFQQIEAIIESNLPPSAYNHNADWWWVSDSLLQQSAWREAGYKADLDLRNKKVTFHKLLQPYDPRKSKPVRVSEERKNERLKKYLLNLKDEEITMTFEQIEAIIRCRLPPSAYNHNADWWWVSDSLLQPWTDAGYDVVELDLINKEVTFHNYERIR